MMKHYLSVVVLLTFAGVASGGAILTVGETSDFWPVGSLVEEDVTVFGLATTLDSYRLAIDFNPGVVRAVGVYGATTEAMDNIGGAITIARKNVGLNYGGTLFRLYFQQVGAGFSFLSIPSSSVTLLDSGGNEIPFTAVGGSLSTGGPGPILTPEPGSLGLLLIGMVGIGAFHLKRRRTLAPVRLNSGGLA
jgi:PEP-CTERM motif